VTVEAQVQQHAQHLTVRPSRTLAHKSVKEIEKLALNHPSFVTLNNDYSSSMVMRN
jgi:hypothetical protein